MQFFYSFKSVTLIWGYLVAGCSPNTLNFIVLRFCTRFLPGLSVLMASNLMTFWNLLLGNLSLSSGVKLLGETMVQTDATLLANNSQHCWMLHVASVCTPCCMLLRIVAQSLKQVKLLAPRTFTSGFILSPLHKNRAVDNGKLLTPSHRPQTIIPRRFLFSLSPASLRHRGERIEVV